MVSAGSLPAPHLRGAVAGGGGVVAEGVCLPGQQPVCRLSGLSAGCSRSSCALLPYSCSFGLTLGILFTGDLVLYTSAAELL